MRRRVASGGAASSILWDGPDMAGVLSRAETIEVALKDDGCGALIDAFANVLRSVPSRLFECALSGDRTKAFIPGADRDANDFAEDGDEFADFGGGFTIGAVHVAWHANDNEFHLLFANECFQPFNDIGERFCRDEFAGVSEHAEFIADSDADALRTVVQSKYPHVRF